MSHKLVNRVKYLTGLSFSEKSILFWLADASYDHRTVFLRMDKLCLYAGCSLSTAKRTLRKLEKREILISIGEGKAGRGYVHHYQIRLDQQEAIVEDEVLPPGEIPPTNGHVGANPVYFDELKDLSPEELQRLLNE